MLEGSQASSGTAPHTPHPSRGEGAWESNMALGFTGLEESKRFIWIWVFCALFEANEGTMQIILHCSSVPQLKLFSRVGFLLAMDQGDVIGFIALPGLAVRC